MKKINIYFIVFALAIVCLPALLSFGIRYLPANNQPPLGVTQKLYGDKIMKDRIGLSENNFSGLGLSFKNPNLINKKEITLEISEENGELLRSSVLSGFNIPDGGFVRFAFEPIADSKGNGYVIALSSPQAKKKRRSRSIYLKVQKILPWLPITSHALPQVLSGISIRIGWKDYFRIKPLRHYIW